MHNSLVKIIGSKQREIVKEYYSRCEKSQKSFSGSVVGVADQKWLKKIFASISTLEHPDFQSIDKSDIKWVNKADKLIEVIISCISKELAALLKEDSQSIIQELAHISGIIYVGLYRIRFQEKLDSYRKNEQQLLSSIVSAQENERRRLASILHDDVMQSIASLMMRVNLLKRVDIEYINEKLHDELTEIDGILKNILQSCRFVNFQTDSLWVEKTGFLPALEVFINDFKQKNDIVVELYCNEFAAELNKDVETHFFRIIQEALQNVKKHAHASHVKITLKTSAKIAFLSIQDNGDGFNYNLLQQELVRKSVKDHFGIISIEHRTKLLGGQFDVYSIPGQGTVLSVKIPLENFATELDGERYNKKVAMWVKSVKASLCVYRP